MGDSKKSALLKLTRRQKNGLLGQPVPAFLKKISVDQLLELGRLAVRRGFSASARPRWIEKYREDIVAIVLMPIGRKSHNENLSERLRCYAGVVTKGRGVAVFTVDVLPVEFDRLPDISDAWELAEILLYDAPHIEIDAETD